MFKRVGELNGANIMNEVLDDIASEAYLLCGWPI